MFYHCTVSLLQCFTFAVACTVSLLHRFTDIVPLFHHCTVAPLYCFTVAPFHCCNISHCFTLEIFHSCTVSTPLHYLTIPSVTCYQINHNNCYHYYYYHYFSISNVDIGKISSILHVPEANVHWLNI